MSVSSYSLDGCEIVRPFSLYQGIVKPHKRKGHGLILAQQEIAFSAIFGINCHCRGKIAPG